MKGCLTLVLGLVALAALVVAPSAFFIWLLNSMAEAGGSSFHIAQEPWNWLIIFMFLAVTKAAFSKT